MKFLHILLAIGLFSLVECTRNDYAGWGVGIDGMVLHTSTSGSIWTRQGSDSIPSVELDGVSAIDRMNAWICGESSGGFGLVMSTQNGGESWVRSGSLSESEQNFLPSVEFMKIHATSKDVVWVSGTNGTVYRTQNGGAGWLKKSPVGFASVNFQGLYALSSDVAWIGGTYLDFGAALLKTTDGGNSWVRSTGSNVSNVDHVLGIAALNESVVWAVGGKNFTQGGGYAVLSSIDGGVNWKLHDEIGGLWDANEVSVVSESVVWIACDHSVYWTTNGGDSWDYSANHGLTLGPYVMGVSAFDDNVAFASVSTANGSLWYTSDGGVTWVQQFADFGSTLPGLVDVSFPLDQFSAASSFGWPCLMLLLLMS